MSAHGVKKRLSACALQRIGRRVLVLDRATHPRFAIGESLTPIGNQILRDLAADFDTDGDVDGDDLRIFSEHFGAFTLTP